jgi:TIR domain
MANIFISLSGKDIEVAAAIGERLRRERSSWSLFYDKDSIRAGLRRQERLREELQSCRLVVVLLSRNWLSSPWCFTKATSGSITSDPTLFGSRAVATAPQTGGHQTPVKLLACRWFSVLYKHGGPGEIRTHDLCLRRAVLIAPSTSFIPERISLQYDYAGARHSRLKGAVLSCATMAQYDERGRKLRSMRAPATNLTCV